MAAAIGNYKPFYAKHVKGIKFGSTAWTEANMISTTIALDTSFATNNATALINLVGSPDTSNPTKSFDFAKDFKETGGDRTSSKEDLLGADSTGTQNTEIYVGANNLLNIECTMVYRNISPAAIFNDTTTCCLIEMDNAESTVTGKVNIVYNNISVLLVGELTRNSDGMMEQKIKFSCRGGCSGTVIACAQSSPAETWSRYRLGLDKAEEIRTA